MPLGGAVILDQEREIENAAATSLALGIPASLQGHD